MVKRILSITFSFFLVSLIAVVDIITGIELSFSIFYLFPILFATWILGINFGFFIALISALAWFATELTARQFNISLFVLIWNTLVRLCYFVIALGLLAKLKKELLLEKSFSRVDYLTGIANTKSFYERLTVEKSRCQRNKTPLTIAYLDCDYFKIVNDVFGHNKGDVVLQFIASGIQDNIRLTDLVARIAGDEFLILLPETGRETAQKVINRTQNQLLDIMKQNNWPVTFSIGVATFIDSSDSIDDMVAKADNLMYSAKDGGRNLIRCAEFINSNKEIPLK